MTIDDHTDRELADALRKFDPAANAQPERLDALSRRIVSAAGPILHRRRRPAVAWWEYPAAWARTLIPLGLATAVAAAAFIAWTSIGWFRHTPEPSLTIADNDTAASQDLLYLLVAPMESHVTPKPPEPR